MVASLMGVSPYGSGQWFTPCTEEENPMKTLLFSAAILGLTASASFATEPVQLTNEQMDGVRAGALIYLRVVADVNNNNVAVPVNAAVAANVLGGGAAAGAVQRPGRQNQ
jgi:hypothetical protein